MYFRGSTNTALTFTAICAADEQSVGISQPQQVLSALQIPFIALFTGRKEDYLFIIVFRDASLQGLLFPTLDI